VIFGGAFNFIGALMGTEVAATIGKGLLDSQHLSMEMVLCALVGAIFWNLFTWYLGLPSSSSHALIGSLIGAACFSKLTLSSFSMSALQSGFGIVHWDNVTKKVVIPMFTSPVLGFIVGFLIMTGLTWLVYRMSVHKMNQVFGKIQIFSAGVMALSHGSNDAQKSMGIIALALMTYTTATSAGAHATFDIPLWVKLSCALAMGLGTLSGGWKIIRTLGSKMIKIQPVHGFAAETTAATLILGASHFGLPVSTTHVITSSIMGVGATKRLSAVKWSVVSQILTAWVLTIPITFIISGLLMMANHQWHWFRG